MLVRTTHFAPIISQNKYWHSLSYILNSHPPPVISSYSSGLRRVLRILSENIISPFSATILLDFSVNRWNTSFNNRFLMQTCSFDAVSDLTWSSGHQEHTCHTGPAHAEVFLFCGWLSLRQHRVVFFFSLYPHLYCKWRPRVSEDEIRL